MIESNIYGQRSSNEKKTLDPNTSEGKFKVYVNNVIIIIKYNNNGATWHFR